VTVADVGLLIVRVVLGGLYLAHGLRKLGWPGTGGFGEFRASIARRGFRPATPWAVAAIASELTGAVLVATGVLAALGAALLFAQSLTIVVLVWPRGFWHDRGGVEYPLLLCAASLGLALTGPGAISLDAALGAAMSEAAGPGFVAIAAVAAVAGLATRGRPA
jgi:putative oxidoreductase